jgi:hypothetical protein
MVAPAEKASGLSREKAAAASGYLPMLATPTLMMLDARMWRSLQLKQKIEQLWRVSAMRSCLAARR